MKINKALVFTLLAMLVLGIASCGEKVGGNGDDTQPDSGKGNTMVIYEANPKLFPKNGSFDAIVARLDDIRDLGVNVLWLMPVYPEGAKNGIGSPYCVKDFKAVNSDYGTLADLKALVNAAHSRGMKVILDWVANHTAWDNAWITEHPDWFTQRNGVIVSPIEQDWSDVADLNYNNTDMRAAMIDAMTYWVREVGVDGFRCDYAEGVPLEFWSAAISAIRAVKQDAIMLAEASNDNLYGAGFDLLYAWEFVFEFPKLFSGTKSVQDIYDLHKREFDIPAGKGRMRHIINHDRATENSLTGFYKSEQGSLAAMAVATFMGGVPMIYSSQEIAYSDKLNFFVFNELDWDSNPSYTTSLQKLMQVYIDSADLRDSEMKLYQAGKAIYIYYTDGLSIIVNPTNEAQTFTVPFERRGDKTVDLISGQSYSLPVSAELAPYEYKILKKN